MIKAGNDSAPAPLAAARQCLESACADLDAAVHGLMTVYGEDVMATPALVGLLLRVVAARRHVRALEVGVSSEIRTSVRSATFS
jgi:hypothetical protein